MNNKIDMNKLIENQIKENNNPTNVIATLINDIENIEKILNCKTLELNKIYSSRAWRVVLFMWKIRDILIPHESKRRFIVKIIFNLISHPRIIFKKININNCKVLYKKNYNKIFKNNIEYLSCEKILKFNNYDFKIKFFKYEQEKTNVSNIKLYNEIRFKYTEQPKVSIIIPVYNEFNYTYLCLLSIFKNTCDIPYEIILADDNSTDITKNIEEKIKGIKIIHNKTNLRFLKNCNLASTKARGKYLIFLNNDTQVQPGWIKPLVEPMDNFKDIGMTGSRLIYPDGSLQEAGGIIWKDGTALNYGKGDDPTRVQYNYSKDVDYISGASICIRRDLWKKIGGFDEYFSPAYCEDSDLAFAVRNAGFRVVYQPHSIVIHFEGVSNGRDLESGVKRYQTENQKKFYKKWKAVLDKENFLKAQNIFWARDRSFNKKTIVIIDHLVPHYDNDAGGRTTYDYLKFFVKLGMHVIFVGDNYYRDEHYTEILESYGIEVLAGREWNINKFKIWALLHDRYIDYIILNRPEVAIKYIDFIKNILHVKTIYYGHDLHFIREERQYKIERKPQLLKSISHWKDIEYKLFNYADVIYTPGIFEKNFLLKDFPNKRIEAIPIFIYDETELDSMCIPDVTLRKDLLFVGGFRHSPNEDAIKWFFDSGVYQKILNSLPGVKVYIVGSHPTDYILSKTSDKIIVTGYVSDFKLEEFYKNCRVSIIPLRYGAGIKGKLVEAICHGLPAVTTSIGAEGLPEVENCVEVSDVNDVNSFINNIVKLMRDDDYWRVQSKKERLYIKNNFTSRKARNILSEDLEF